MSSNNIKSSSIKVYPCANRTYAGDTNARLTTEFNITSLINRLVDLRSFVVSDYTSSGEFIFNINGYLFTVNSNELSALLTSTNPSYLYACICVGDNGDFRELLPINKNSIDVITDDGNASTIDDGVFYGVYFKTLDTLYSESKWSKSATDTQINPIFDGLTVNVTTTTYTFYALPILSKSGSTISVPAVSKIKFKTNSSKRSVTIDDGEIL